VYKNSVAEMAPIKHKLYASEDQNIIICVGDAQPSIPEESLRLAQKIADIAVEMGVTRVYTMAAFPNEFYDDPKVYGIFTDESMKDELVEAGVEIIKNDGAVNGLNGVMVCLMGDITYANVPQHLASKAVLHKLVKLIDIEIDTKQLDIRAKKIDASIKRRLDIYEEEEETQVPDEKRLGYIS